MSLLHSQHMALLKMSPTDEPRARTVYKDLSLSHQFTDLYALSGAQTSKYFAIDSHVKNLHLKNYNKLTRFLSLYNFFKGGSFSSNYIKRLDIEYSGYC